MAKKVKLKTAKNTASVSCYLNSIEPASARKDAKTLAKIFKEASGCKPKMWGGSIVGYGEYTYYRANGDEGEILATGFAARKTGPVLYNMPSSKEAKQLLESLGPHKLGKSCLYLKRLDDINLDSLSGLIRLGLKDLQKRYDVRL